MFSRLYVIFTYFLDFCVLFVSSLFPFCRSFITTFYFLFVFVQRAQLLDELAVERRRCEQLQQAEVRCNVCECVSGGWVSK